MRNLYHISLVGGPWDGVEVDLPEFLLQFALSLPARPDGDHWDASKCSVAASMNRSAYLLTCSRFVHDNGGAAVHLQYDFLSFEAHCDRAVVERPASTNWRSTLMQFLRGCRQHFVSWVLAPVDYPLDVRRLCPTEVAGATCQPQREASRTAREAGLRSAQLGRFATKHK